MEGSREEQQRRKVKEYGEMNTYGSADPKPPKLSMNSSEILTEVAMDFRVFCERKY